MPYYLVYQRCSDCTDGNCFQCVQPGRNLVLRVVQADEIPEHAINGPCDTAQELIGMMSKHFDFDPETGLMFFKQRPAL